jgi:hypothetical protein
VFVKLQISAIVVMVLYLGTVALSANARSTVPVVNFEHQTWTRADNQGLSADEVRKVILAAVWEHRISKRAQWQIEPTGDGNLLASVLVRGKHTIRVLITHTAIDFSARYHSSIDMNAGKDENGRDVIHPHYNRWVADLVRAIRDRLSRACPATSPTCNVSAASDFS